MSKFKVASILFLFSTLLLKFSSMLRDMTIAGLFGASGQSDIYFAAMTIPNAIVLFMLTGMKDAFLPSYYKFDREGRGFSHLTNVVKGTFWITIGISIIGIIVSPFLMRLLYPEFGRYEDGFEIATWTAIIYFVAIIFVGMNAVYEGFFDSQKKFSFSTFSQTVVVLVMIGFSFLFYQQLEIYAVPIGYLIGTVISFLIKLVYLKPKRFMAWKQKIDRKEVKAFYLIFLPVGLTIAIGQINLTVDSIFSAQMETGVVSNLNYAFRLVNIPQAIFGVTIATLVFPLIASAYADKKMDQFKGGIEKGLIFMFMFLIPTIAGMILVMEPLVKIFFERGQFDAAATADTSTYAIFYVGSVLFYSIQAVIAKGFYTMSKGHYILRIGLISIVLNIIFNWWFSSLFGAVGLALASSVVGMLYSIMTFTTLYKITGGFDLKMIGWNMLKVLIAGSVMTAVLIGLQQTAIPSLPIILYLAIIGVSGIIVYAAGLYLLKSQPFKELIARGGNRG
ncbi:murein biosynthesis integral membrane protein MurJ [Jeotgalibacillus salarius]|uniref:Murein biosynthesis integral membrane protein MurJ n=1 Tax=Jeotgalibacillus salarius TaxID=546023 RepID=A0A4Y8LM07_9BACL|nr:murein biosynthesis integral membrane protein MurJ [Jeotgalibacillus salarius]TFE04068.1 murein biosynthesis integral membrane protein MurJ [Jeotgalibacillus salarius]